MKIVAISDTHGFHNHIKLPKGDILIHAGDISGRGRFVEIELFIEWINSMKNNYKHILFIAGNHDFGLNMECELLDSLPDNVHYLEDSAVIIDGIKFYGTPWTPIFHNWAFMESEINLSTKFAKIPDDVDVLITHGPAHTILDKTIRNINVGSIALYNRISELKNLKYHIHGHIHESYGFKEIKGVKHYNVSSLNHHYKNVNKPIKITI